jgi:hypothetical protein
MDSHVEREKKDKNKTHSTTPPSTSPDKTKQLSQYEPRDSRPPIRSEIHALVVPVVFCWCKTTAQPRSHSQLLPSANVSPDFDFQLPCHDRCLLLLQDNPQPPTKSSETPWNRWEGPRRLGRRTPLPCLLCFIDARQSIATLRPVVEVKFDGLRHLVVFW